MTQQPAPEFATSLAEFEKQRRDFVQPTSEEAVRICLKHRTALVALNQSSSFLATAYKVDLEDVAVLIFAIAVITRHATVLAEDASPHRNN